MAKQVQIFLIDDLDESKAARTVTFGLENDQYEMDLSQENIDKLHEALRPFIEKARRVRGGVRRRRGQAAVPGTPSKSTLAREWAREQGMKVSERGRVSKEIMDAYEASLR